MFIDAIEKAIFFTKPLLNGQMIYKDRAIMSNIHSLTVLNDEGDILTCGFIADLFKMSEEINDVFVPILQELKNKLPKEIKKIEKKYDIKEQDLIFIHNIIVDIANNPGRLNIIKHPVLDIAIIRLERNQEIFVKDFPVFRKDNVKIGEQVCKIGYAFPEYDTFYYDEHDCIIKTHNRIMNFPVFPLDGMVTRNIVDPNHEITMFEMSTTCLPGQAGGPIIDQDGNFAGLLVGTKRISSSYNSEMPFELDLAVGVHVNAIKDFLDANDINYYRTTNSRRNFLWWI